MGRIKAKVNSKINSKKGKYILDVPSWKKIGRSYEKITKDDLERLLKLTKDDYDDFVNRHPKYKDLKILSICLCQGAALHYIDGQTGVRDFDIFMFFERKGCVRYPFRRRGFKDFGKSKFGKTYINLNNFKSSSKSSSKYENTKGRTIDIMGREINNIDNDYEKSIQEYLANPKSDTSYYLSQKAVVVLEPIKDLGKIIWGQ